MTSTKVSDNIVYADGANDNFAASKDIIFGFSYDLNVAGNLSVAVFKQGSNGQITKVASQAATGPKDLRVHNNGEWMGFQSKSDNYLRLFRLNSTNQLVDETTIKEPANLYFLLPDNTLVYFGVGYKFETMFYTGNGQWTLQQDKSISAPIDGVLSFPLFPGLANNNTLFWRNSTGTVQIYARTNDGGWKYDGSFDDGLGFASLSYNHNGVDTIVALSSTNALPGKTKYGYLAFFTKSGNQWVKTAIGVDDLPVTGFVNIGGYSHAFVNNDVFVVTASYDGYGPSKKRQAPTTGVGSLLFFQRQVDNSWKLIAKSNRTEIGFYGYVSVVTNTHVLTLLTNTTATSPGGLGFPSAFYGISNSQFTPVPVAAPVSSPVKKTSSASVLSSILGTLVVLAAACLF